MGDVLAVTCGTCGQPMVPNVSTLDDDGCGWICLNPSCPELAASELEAEDLVEAGASDGLAVRLARLIQHLVDAADSPASTRERAQADLAQLRGELIEMGRRAETSAALADRLGDMLPVSYASDDFASAQDAKQALAVVSALCATIGRTVADAQTAVLRIDPELPGFMGIDGPAERP